ncbi:MAG: THUMP domain-containing class I SAM-dependent RNA methyltransferase [Burkholderiales bacterium]
MSLQLFAPCPRGLETLLAAELSRLGAGTTKTTDGGVTANGDARLLYRANLESRLASRILLLVGGADYRSADDIYRAARAVDWMRWFDGSCTIRVAVSAIRSPLESLDFVTLRVKDGVCDMFRDATGSRPDVDTRTPDVRIHVFLHHNRASFYLDTSGDPLFKRGWRTSVVDAPLRENLAAGILQIAGWHPHAPLLDPMCGGGTFLLEAATIALGIAPGTNRGFAFERLSTYDARLWREVRETADAARQPLGPLPIHGSDHDRKAVNATRDALRRAGIEAAVSLQQIDILEASAPAPNGILVANPPYGVRIGEQEALAAFYPKLGDRLKRHFAGWRCCFFTADTRLPKLIGLKPARRTPLYNGALECRLYAFDIVSGSMRARSRTVAQADRPAGSE